MSIAHPFLNRLDRLHEVPLLYEDEETRVLAESLVPIDDLQERVAAQGAPVELARDLLLVELLGWFKRDCFSWIDKPKCDACGTETQQAGVAEPRSEERRALASHVELYSCKACCRQVRFPRYNCPRKLLETRGGRCGEWANAFTLVCLAMGFEARYIWDVTDHVWTEVWSDAKRRWLHCDPCEAVCDTPLLYERGWGKKLSYVFAFTPFETVDVTWRYVSDFKETMSRRRSLPESMLVRYQDLRNKAFQQALGHEERAALQKRRVMELTEFLTPPKVRSSGELQGRNSGDLAWRLDRKETSISRVIRNTRSDIKTMEITYSSANDTYMIREDDAVVETARGWAQLMHSELNIMRKVEHDWNMTYLARYPGCSLGVIQYQIELDKPCRSVEVTFVRKTFESGEVVVNLQAGSEDSLCIRSNDPVTLSFLPDICPTRLTLTCELSGGVGDNAWQHAQAFRQAIPPKSTGTRAAVPRASSDQPHQQQHADGSDQPALKLKLFF